MTLGDFDTSQISQFKKLLIRLDVDSTSITGFQVGPPGATAIIVFPFKDQMAP